MNKKQIRLTESELKQIVKESVNKILKEETGRDALIGVLKKAFANLTDNEREYIYMWLNDETWEVVYAAMNILKPHAPIKQPSDQP